MSTSKVEITCQFIALQTGLVSQQMGLGLASRICIIIMEMSNLAAKPKSLKLELFKDILIHLVIIFCPAQFNQFKVSYNTQKDKWTLNELISHCVQEEDRLK